MNELKEACANMDIVEIADALGDIQYVLDGFFLNCGLHNYKDTILNEIHASNLSKTCSSQEEAEKTVTDVKEKLGDDCYIEPVGKFFIVKRKSDNKVMKSINYFKPNLKEIVKFN
jgi:predicted HAD superfamily Cof-like phosphohydrolase